MKLPINHDTPLPLPNGWFCVAWSSDLGFAIVDPEVAEIARAAFDALVGAASLTVDPHPIAFADPIPVWGKVGGADTWVHIPDGCYPERADELDPRVRPGFDAAARVTLPKFGKVLQQRLVIEDAMADVFDSIAVLATPMAAIPAYIRGTTTEPTASTRFRSAGSNSRSGARSLAASMPA